MGSERIIQQIKPVLQRHNITRAALFGSYARGDATDTSDVDILIDPPEHMSLLGLVGLQHELGDALQKKVDVVTFGGLSPYLKPYVDKDMVYIFN